MDSTCLTPDIVQCIECIVYKSRTAYVLSYICVTKQALEWHLITWGNGLKEYNEISSCN